MNLFTTLMGFVGVGLSSLLLLGCSAKAPAVVDSAGDVVEDVVVDAVEVVEEVVAKNVEFALSGFNFGYSLATLEVNKGDTVTINFESVDGFHDWVVDEFGAATEKVNTGTSTSVTFVADKAGEYEFYCSVGQHRANGMVGKLIVK